jgi:uncharacterized membrane protein
MSETRTYTHPATLLILAIGVALRFFALAGQSFWYDEIHSILTARGAPDGSLSLPVLNIHGPLYLILLRLWMSVAGSSELAVRALSAVLGSLGLVLFYRVGLRLLGRSTALVALALLAASPFYLWYSQEARNYTLLFCLGLVAVPAFLDEMERRSAGTFLRSLLATAATCLSNLSGCFLYVLFGIYALTRRGRAAYPMRRLIALALLSALVLAPWILRGAGSTGELHLGRVDEGAGVMAVKGESPPGLLSIPYTFYNFSLGTTVGPSIDELKRRRIAALIPHLWLLIPAAAIFATAALRGLARAPASRRLLLLLWIAVPVLMMASVSALNLKAPNSRYAFLALAPYVFVLAAGVTSFGSRAGRALMLAAILVLMGVADYNYFTDRRYWRPDARSAAHLLLKESRPGDAVVVYALDLTLRYYIGDEAYGQVPAKPIKVVKPRHGVFVDEPTMEAWLAKNTAGARRVWVVQCMGWWVDPEDRFVGLCRQIMIPEGQWHFTKVPVYLFEKRTPPGDGG